MYRSVESLFRGILRSQGMSQGNFGVMSLTLSELALPTNEEQIILNQVRRHRNLMLHRAGEKIKITQAFAKSFLDTIESILIRASSLVTSKNDE